MTREQPTLFDLGEPVSRTVAQPAMPFDEQELIDVARTARILGVTDSTVHRMLEAKLIASTRRGSGRGLYQVSYWSLVRYCDALRVRYHIADRRKPRSAHAPRYRDADLLPFPLDDTIRVEDAMQILNLSSKRSVHKRIEEGRFECYRLVDFADWRISRTSFTRYVARIRESAIESPTPRYRRS